MSLRIKEEHIDKTIKNPFMSGHICLRFVEPALYKYISDAGYSDLFEEIPTIKTKDTKNDLPKK